MYGVALESAKRQVGRIAVLAGVGATFLVAAIPAQATPPNHASGHGQVVQVQQAAPKGHGDGGGGRGHKVA